ncbi:MAG TPA: class I SAM-dependent methyltransferase [Candidatus Eisenbacteria bacterium]|nr:class I SAM-dependent methyltransferase [Candidatus Eisenbacteria bacterium]
MTIERQVAEHYTQDQLDEKILQAVRSAGKNPDSITPHDLDALDNLHLGGRESIQELSAFMDLRPGMHLLDVGCGVGGPARYFAEHGCHVTGIDLSEEFIRVATSLTHLVRLNDRASFQRGSALEMPFASASFDGAYMIHVGMNVSNKAGLFREVARVLKPAARFAIFDIIRTSDGELQFPVPWALTPETSFVANADDYRLALEAAGFKLSHQRSRRQFAIDVMQKRRQQAAAGSVLAVNLLMGEKTPLMLKNVNQSILAGTMEPVELVAIKG